MDSYAWCFRFFELAFRWFDPIAYCLNRYHLGVPVGRQWLQSMMYPSYVLTVPAFNREITHDPTGSIR